MTNDDHYMPFWEHLEELRWMLLRCIVVIVVFSVGVFFRYEFFFDLLLRPARTEGLQLIATQLGSQFIVHLSVSLSLGMMCSIPWILVEIFRFIAPALRLKERRLAVWLMIAVYILFALGVLVCYFILFPVCVHFLGGYSVSSDISTMVTIDSYIGTFTTMSLSLGLVFQLPTIVFILARMGVVNSYLLASYRRHALLVLLLLAAFITPPDAMSLLVVSLPLYLLYELSIGVARLAQR